ncbi:GIY-YIG nuclease family protein [Shimia ponticola]|uniref:GIY-YIG nuclease family protein n=1 Tax=Shimia ponticola TaxID=2582893 RepID=UPI0011BE580A|nr:GIY-YIG nuclease family protein [Shimia ponticola]
MFVYMMTNKPDGTLYLGVTNDLVRRVHEHRTHAIKGFTDRYNLTRLVWFEQHDEPHEAIRREKALKRLNRAWKTALIEKTNPTWRDLWDGIIGSSPTMTARGDI